MLQGRICRAKARRYDNPRSAMPNAPDSQAMKLGKEGPSGSSSAAESHDAQPSAPGQERKSALGSLALLAFCLLVGLISVAVCVYLALIGQLLTLDGMLLALLSLSIGAIFVANVAWSAYTGELKRLLQQLNNRD